MFRLPSNRKDALNVAFIFSIVGLFIFQNLFFQNETFFFRDFYRYFFPARLNAVALLKWQGLGAWDPYLDGGMPMLGDLSHYSALYPASLLFFFMEPISAFNALAFWHFIVLAVGAYFFFERFSNSNIGAWVFAAGLSLSGMFLSGLDRPSYFYSAAYMPWVAWGWVNLGLVSSEKNRPRAYALLALLSVCQFTAGEFQVFLLSHFLGVIFFNLIKSRVRVVPKGDLRAALAALNADLKDFLWVGLLILGFSAIQWLPTMELGFASTRGQGMAMERMGRNSLHPLQLLTLLFPFPFPIFPSEPGFKAYQTIFQNEGIGLFLSFHTGIILALFAGLYFLQKGDRAERWLLGGTFLYFLLLSLGKYFPAYFSVARHLVPFSNAFVFPSKYFLPCVFLICFFSARFFSAFHLEETQPRYFKAVVAVMVFSFSLFVFLPKVFGLFSNEMSDAALKQVVLHGRFQIGASLFFLTCVLGVLFLRRMGRIADNLLMLLLVVELLFYAPFIIWTAPRSFFENQSSFLSKVRPQASDRSLLPEFRIAAIDFDAQKISPEKKGVEALWQRRSRFFQALNNNVGIVDGLAYAEKYGPLRLASTYDFWMNYGLDRLSIFRLLSTRFYIVPDEADFPIAKNLAKISRQDGFTLYEDVQAKPMAWMSYWWEKDGEKKTRTYEDAVPISNFQKLTLPPEKPKTLWQIPSQIRAIENGYVVSVQSEGPGFLIVSENDFPGWRAFVDNRPTAIARAYGTFKAVFLAAGQHEVRFEYKPFWPKCGALVSILTVLVLGWVLFKRRKLV